MGNESDTLLAEDTRDAKALSADENADLCTGCTRCCETVSIEVDAPRAAWEYDQWIWVLHHQNLELYVERPERWYLHIETRCAQLNDAGRCRIHGSHPVLCREYDPRSCERRHPLSDVVAWFKQAGDLERWIETKRPAHWKRLLLYRSATPVAPPVTASISSLVAIAEPGARVAHEPQAHPRRTRLAPRRP